MSLPALPTLSVARVRAGFARGAAAALPALRLWMSGAAPGEYRSPFTIRLRLARTAVVALAAVWLGVGFYALDATRTIVRIVGHDTAPSIAAAEAIRTGLNAANADYARAMLANEAVDGDLLVSMRSHIGAVDDAIIDAASNITFGDEERQPTTTLLRELDDYEELVSRSIASTANERLELAFSADQMLHHAALPVAVTLERVNADHLTASYEAYLGRWPVWWFVAAGLLLGGSLIAVQVDVARAAKRLLNPGLALATAVVIVATAVVATSLAAAQTDLRVAKTGAFDSVYALSSSQAVAADADAAQSLFLLARDDPGRAQAYSLAFNARARRLLSEAGPWVLSASPVEQRHAGFLGEELANVTFPGEADAVREAVQAWDAVREGDAVLQVEAPHDPAAARESVSVDRPGSMRHAFARFDAALAKVLAINQDAFASSIAAAEGEDAPLGVALAAGFVLAVAAAWFGIGRRLDEYRF